MDGRYVNHTKPLQKYFSEYSLFKYRTHIEIEYFIFLHKTGIPELSQLSHTDIRNIKNIDDNFSYEDCITIKTHESIIHHDVKAIEYFLYDKFDSIQLSEYKQFIHFGLTSQDINDPAIMLSIKDTVENITIPTLERILDTLYQLSNEWIECTMISRTHGQPAVPTSMGKEIQVFHYRISKELNHLRNIYYWGKFGGAIGNLNAHCVTYPNYNWQQLMDTFMESLSLKRNKLTTQINNYESISIIFDTLKRIDIILIDMNKDVWHYISIEYFIQKYDENHVGSSTMPHKINPIQFENSEGNLMMANCLFAFMSERLPISRLQRDLTGSTILRNIGTSFGHQVVAFNNLLSGLNKLEINHKRIQMDLYFHPVVIVEAFQVVLKKYGHTDSYEMFKNLTRNNCKLDLNDIHCFIEFMNISKQIKTELYKITVETYVGYSNKMAIY